MIIVEIMNACWEPLQKSLDVGEVLVSLPIDRHIINIMYFHFHFRHFSVKYMHLDSYKEVLEIIREERFLIPEL